jgi:hypothetical protein
VTLEEKIEELAKKGLLGVGLEEETADSYAPWAALLAQFAPGVGAVTAADNTREAVSRGDYGEAAIEAGLGLLGEVPGIGDAAVAGIKGLRRAPDNLLNAKEVAPKRSRKKVSDMTPEEHEAHKAWQRQQHIQKNLAKNPNYVPRGSPKRLLTPEEIEAQIADRKARDAARKRSARADPVKGQVIRDQLRDSYKKNQGQRIADNALHRAQRNNRIVPWSDSDKINEIYNARAIIERETGIPHHVDHMIPLIGKNVSGLHHQDNLMIVPAMENRKKKNRFTPGTPPPKAGGVRQARRLLKQLEKAGKGSE